MEDISKALANITEEQAQIVLNVLESNENELFRRTEVLLTHNVYNTLSTNNYVDVDLLTKSCPSYPLAASYSFYDEGIARDREHEMLECLIYESEIEIELIIRLELKQKLKPIKATMDMIFEYECLSNKHNFSLASPPIARKLASEYTDTYAQYDYVILGNNKECPIKLKIHSFNIHVNVCEFEGVKYDRVSVSGRFELEFPDNLEDYYTLLVLEGEV